MNGIPDIGAIDVQLTTCGSGSELRLTRLDVPACGFTYRSQSDTHGPRITAEPDAIRVDRFAYTLHPRSPVGRTDLVRLRMWTAQRLIERLRVWGFTVTAFRLEPGFEELLKSAGCARHAVPQ